MKCYELKLFDTFSDFALAVEAANALCEGEKRAKKFAAVDGEVNPGCFVPIAECEVSESLFIMPWLVLMLMRGYSVVGINGDHFVGSVMTLEGWKKVAPLPDWVIPKGVQQ